MATKLFKDLSGTEIKADTMFTKKEIGYYGDPIFIVDPKELVIKTCIAKHILAHDNKFITINCCEKGKHSDYIPSVKDSYVTKKLFSDGYCVLVNRNSSSSGIASTSLAGALKILDLFKNKGNFASLEAGDKIYAVLKNKNEIRELVISYIDGKDNLLDTTTINCIDRTKINVRISFFEEKASIFSDYRFSFYLEGHFYPSDYVFLFVSKEKAEAFLNAKKKEEKKKDILPSKGTSTKLNDSKGNLLHVGDTVAYVNGCNSRISISTGRIINFTKKMITILDSDEKERLIQQQIEWNKTRMEKGLKAYEYSTDNYGIHPLATNKLLLINSYKTA